MTKVLDLRHANELSWTTSPDDLLKKYSWNKFCVRYRINPSILESKKMARDLKIRLPLTVAEELDLV